MKILSLLIPFFLLQGCFYFNDTGISKHLYEDCEEYYDSTGTYHKACTPNIIDYDCEKCPKERCCEESECYESKSCQK